MRLKPATAFVKPREGERFHAPNVDLQRAPVALETLDLPNLETATAIRVGIVDTIDYTKVEGRYRELASSSLALEGVPVRSPFSLRLEALGHTKAPPKKTMTEVPRQLLTGDTAPTDQAPAPTIEAAQVVRGAHHSVVDAGKAFVADFGRPLRTMADFRAFHAHVLNTSIWSAHEAEGYAHVLAELPTKAARDGVALTLRVVNGANVQDLVGFLHRDHYLNSVYINNQVNALLTAPHVVLHEYGHHMLAHQPDVLEAAVAFEIERQQLKPGVDVYNALVNDDWLSADSRYQEKLYSNKLGVITNAELLPVALQHFSTPAALAHLHRHEPELFHFALGVLRPNVPRD